MTNRLTVERDCAALVAGFAYHIDNGHYADVLNLFAPDGSFERPGISARGQAEIDAMLRARPSDVATRHVCGPPLFLSTSDAEASAVTYFTLYQVPVGDGPYPEFAGPAAIAEYRDHFVLTPMGWRFASRRVSVAMVRATA